MQKNSFLLKQFKNAESAQLCPSILNTDLQCTVATFLPRFKFFRPSSAAGNESGFRDCMAVQNVVKWKSCHLLETLLHCCSWKNILRLKISAHILPAKNIMGWYSRLLSAKTTSETLSTDTQHFFVWRLQSRVSMKQTRCMWKWYRSSCLFSESLVNCLKWFQQSIFQIKDIKISYMDIKLAQLVGKHWHSKVIVP